MLINVLNVSIMYVHMCHITSENRINKVFVFLAALNVRFIIFLVYSTDRNGTHMYITSSDVKRYIFFVPCKNRINYVMSLTSEDIQYYNFNFKIY